MKKGVLKILIIIGIVVIIALTLFLKMQNSSETVVISNSKLKAIDCLSEQRNVDECIEIYQPVCGQVRVECIKEPCDLVKETFENSCKACMNERVISYVEGVCLEDDEIRR